MPACILNFEMMFAHAFDDDRFGQRLVKTYFDAGISTTSLTFVFPCWYDITCNVKHNINIMRYS